MCLQCLQKRSQTGTILCSLMFDEVAIRKHVQWNGHELEGFVDLGNRVSDDSLPVASEALMFLVVSLTGNWKNPIGYFLCDGMSSDEKYALVREALVCLYEVNVVPVCLVCDGPATNFSLAHKLGAWISVSNVQPWFQHLCDSIQYVCFVFYACHMLKLMRNVLAEKGSLTNLSGRQIRWQYIRDLYELQDAEGLKAANKLRRNHIEWYQQKMKVSLAAQVFSRSVANALDFVSHDLKLQKFIDADATVDFIRRLDQLFDALNSRSPFEKEFKSVLKPCNELFWRPFLVEAIDWLLNLRLGDVPLYLTPRKTCVLGFVATIHSVIRIFDTYVRSGQLPYLATYRMSQDHIELSFNVIRSRGRWNNNPTAGQFRAAYRQLLMSRDIKPTATGNAVAQEELAILCPDIIVANDDNGVPAVTTYEILHKFGMGQTETCDDHSYCEIPTAINLSEFASNVVTYMAGYVARNLSKKLKCMACQLLLLSDGKLVENCKLLSRKDNGGLLVPSDDNITVCVFTERCVRYLCNSSVGKIPRGRNINLSLQIAVIEMTRSMNLFVSANDDHSCSVEGCDNRSTNLTRLVVNEYTNVRFHAVGRLATEKIRGRHLRFQSNKNVLFSHQ